MRRLCVLLALWGCDDDDSGVTPPPDLGGDAAAGDLGVDGGPADAGAPDGAAPDAALACDPTAERAAYPLGDWTVEVAANGDWLVSGHGGTLAAVAPCEPSVRVGVGAPDLRAGFGSFMVGLGALDWAPASAAEVRVEADDAHVRLDFGEAALLFRTHERGLEVRVESGADAAELRWRCGEGDGYFGLGSQVVGLNLRGRNWPLFTQEQGISKNETGAGFPLANTVEAAYAPMGVWHAWTGPGEGYAAVLGPDEYSEVDLCATDEEAVALRTLGADPWFVLVPGETPRERMAAVTEIVGRPPPSPDWTFAPWNDAVGGPARLREVAEKLRAEGVPSSAIWSEDWIGGEQGPSGFRLSYAWEWDPEQYPDLPAEVARLHDEGFAFLAYFNSFVPEPTRMFDEGVEGGFLIADAAGDLITFLDPAFRNTSLVDLTNPDALAWLTGYLTRAVTEIGVDGWMADFSEWLPVETALASGETGWQGHNPYPLWWQRANLEAFAETRPDGNYTFFARSGWASVESGGSAGATPTMWGGDQETDWSRTDGLPTVLSIAVNLGLAGVGVFGSDIAGYSSFRETPNTNKELFYRWTEVGAFHPLMRTHHGSDECGNWAFDRDAETLAHYRRWARVHTRLFPLWRRLADESSATGLPITRHPVLVEPDRPELWADATDQHFVGDDLLVAPVVVEGATSRPVRLPSVGWWPLFGDAPLDAAELEVDLPITETGVFVRPGTVLELLPRAVDSLYGATVDGVTDLEDLAGERTLAVYPAAGEVPDWGAAALDEAPLPECVDEGPPSCRRGDGATVVGPGTLTAGPFVVPLEEGTWHLAVARAAWGELAEPTVVTDLDPDIPPPCAE